MNRNDKKMGDRRPETGVQRATPAAPPFPVSDLRSPVSLLQPFQRASSLVTTLLVLVVLSTIVVVFMQSMTVERNVAKSVKNKYQAGLAAEAAMQEFLTHLYATKESGPYSAIYVPGPNDNPYLFLAKREFQADATITRRIPLFSTIYTDFDNLTNFAAPFLSSIAVAVGDIDRSGHTVNRLLSSSNDIYCDINKTNANLPFGAIGLRTTITSTNHPALPVNWVYLKNTFGKVIGRYAYWADDECSKLDIRYAGNSANVSGSHSRSNGASLSELSLLVLTNLPSVTSNITPINIANLLAVTNSSLSNLPINASHLQYPLATGLSNLSTNQWQALKPFVTIYSLHDDRSLDGKRRLNLNELVTSTTNANEIARQAIAIRAAITNNLPNFGQRFYSAANGTLSQVTEDHQKTYATRIAANIRDFIDADNNATIIWQDDTAYSGNAVDFMIFDPITLQDDDLPRAFGKEGGLYLSEYSRVVRVIEPVVHPASSTTAVTLRVRFGHYVELCNISGKTIKTEDLGTDPHIVLGGRTVWQNGFASGSPSTLRLSDVKMRLPTGLSIPPGGIVYFTTDGGDFPRDSQTGLIGTETTNRYQLSYGPGVGQWELINTNGNAPLIAGATFEDYSVITRATNSISGNVTNERYAVYCSPGSSPTYTDQQERLIFANSTGIIDCAFRIYGTRRHYLMRNAQNPTWLNTFLNDPEAYGTNNAPSGSSSARYTRGDLRGNFEIMSVIKKSTSLAWKTPGDGEYGTTMNDPSIQQSLGRTNYNYTNMPTYTGVDLWRKGWFEYTPDPAGNHFVNNTNLTSLGQLGYVYDPMRYDIEGYRSMGATLRLGQSDASTNNRATNNTSNFTSWLGGRGDDDPTSTNFSRNAFLLADVFRTDTNRSGRINPNSIIRDGSGVVMQAALADFYFESNSTNGAASHLSGNKTLTTTNTIRLIREFATNNSNTNGFLVSIGDLSRVPAFWSTNNDPTNTIVPGVRMSDVSDSGKEEFFRRTASLLTTQSLAYTIYVVGQAGEIVTRGGSDIFMPASTVISESVVQMEPIYPSAQPWEAAVPSSWNLHIPKSIKY
jgi:type II secretory pathway pseudopilin PulG